MRKVLVVGDANVDIIVPYPKLDREKKNIVYPTPCLQGGGTSANTAVALSRLGVETGFIGTVGEDQYGKFIRKDLEAEKVDTAQLIIEPELNTVGVFAFIDETGERYLWGWPRVDQTFKELDENKVDFNTIKESCWVHSSGMSLVYDTSARYTITKLFKTAYEAGIPTSFDLNLRVDNGMLEPSYKMAVMEIMKYSTYVLGSAEEEFYYLGESKDWMENAKSFVTKDRTIIVRMGKDGSIGLTWDGQAKASSYPVEVVDTVGAGDVYNAGFIAAKLKGYSLEACLNMGNAVAGYTVSKKGARNCPHSDELEEFLRKYEKHMHIN
jgi:fructokinase